MAITYDNLKASDGTGNAVLAHIESDRAALATVIDVDSVDNWPAEFIVTTGTLLPTGFIDPDTQLEFEAHLNGGDIEIDAVMPGYTDVGNTDGQVAFIKPTTGFADGVADLAKVSHNPDGTIKDNVITTPDQFADPVDPALRLRENGFDYVASGCVLTGTGYGSNLAWSLTAGVVYINGKRYTVAAATGVVVASKDTYFDLLEPVSGQVATLVYTGSNSVTNNAASPTLAANSVRIAIIQSGATIANIAAINQGQEDKVLPIASSVAYAVTDSLGNLICPRDPESRLLGYGVRGSDFSSATVGSYVDVTGVATTIKVPEGRKVELAAVARSADTTTAAASVVFAIREGSTVLSTCLMIMAADQKPMMTSVILTPSAGVHTYKLSSFASAGTHNIYGASKIIAKLV